MKSWILKRISVRICIIALTAGLLSACGSAKEQPSGPAADVETESPSADKGSAETPAPAADTETPEPAAEKETPEPAADTAPPAPAAETETPEPAADKETAEASEETETPGPAADAEVSDEASAADESRSLGGKKEEAVPLLQFCNDPGLDAWFASLEQEPPVKLTCWIFGEGPISMEFTDQELILETAECLQGVQIDGVANENPDNVADAGGWGYYFENADGTSVGFTFILGCFSWGDSEWHAVASFSSMSEIDEKLLKIGNPQYVPALSDDAGFYTRYLETYQTEWESEEDFFGGLSIYLEEPKEPPYLKIARVLSDETDAGKYLEGEGAEQLKKEIEAAGGTAETDGEITEYKYGGRTLTGTLYTVTDVDRNSYELLVLILEKKDNLLGENRLVRFLAAYQDENEEAVMKSLQTAVKEFSLRHMPYEEKEVQPDSLLVDFCNSDAIRAWMDSLEENFPDVLIYMTDTWYAVEDPDLIRNTLEALKSVRIGEETDGNPGASGRRTFDFINNDTGNTVSFEFYEDTFDYEGKRYEVLDWGGLLELDPLLTGN